MKKLFLTMILVLTFAVPAFSVTLDDIVLDAGLTKIADECEILFVGTDGTYANRLGQVTLTEGCGNGDYTAIGNGETEGRALGITAQTITASGTGTATHYGFYNAGNTIVYFSNTLTTSKGMTSGNSYEYDAMPYAITARDGVSE